MLCTASQKTMQFVQNGLLLCDVRIAHLLKIQYCVLNISNQATSKDLFKAQNHILGKNLLLQFPIFVSIYKKEQWNEKLPKTETNHHQKRCLYRCSNN
jgi:hypothetical protein